MVKKYSQTNVYDATQERLKYIFDEFDNIYISFSGGKDSGVLLNLVIDYMKKNNIKKKIGVLIIDLEAQYTTTINYITETIKEFKDYIQLYWVCLPLNLRNAVSNIQPFWCCWEEGKTWVRNIPKKAITINNHNFSFYNYRMEFEKFIVKFGNWYSKGEKVACLVGIRSDESLNRYCTINNKDKKKYKDKQYSTYINTKTYNFYPIYDWKTKDIWVYNGKYHKNYNKIYDKFFEAGVSLDNMRICQPYGDDQKIGLNLYKELEPEVWQKLLYRVSGVNFGNIYCGTKAIGYGNIKLPDSYNWKTYTKFLLNTLPLHLRINYTKKFIKFIKFWYKNGSAVEVEIYEKLKKLNFKVKSGEFYKDDKIFITFKNIPNDTNNIGYLKLLNWKRLAICILKNDIACKSLSFGMSKDSVFKQIEKLSTAEKWK